jgi:hypothetical protein
MWHIFSTPSTRNFRARRPNIIAPCSERLLLLSSAAGDLCSKRMLLLRGSFWLLFSVQVEMLWLRVFIASTLRCCSLLKPNVSHFNVECRMSQRTFTFSVSAALICRSRLLFVP